MVCVALSMVLNLGFAQYNLGGIRIVSSGSEDEMNKGVLSVLYTVSSVHMPILFVCIRKGYHSGGLYPLIQSVGAGQVESLLEMQPLPVPTWAKGFWELASSLLPLYLGTCEPSFPCNGSS